MAATLTFTAAAAVSCLITSSAATAHWVVFVVLLAAAAFAVLAGYWLRRDQGTPVVAGPGLDQASRVIIGLATLSAGVFGLLPLIAPVTFASVFGLVGTDIWIYRMAGSACFGYAVAGVLELRAPGYPSIAVQNLAAIAFNAFAAVASWLSVASGTGGILAPGGRRGRDVLRARARLARGPRPLIRRGARRRARARTRATHQSRSARSRARAIGSGFSVTSRALFQPSIASAPMRARPERPRIVPGALEGDEVVDDLVAGRVDPGRADDEVPGEVHRAPARERSCCPSR